MEHGVEVLTLYAFSTETRWPQEEMESLAALLGEVIGSKREVFPNHMRGAVIEGSTELRKQTERLLVEVPKLHQDGIQLRYIGRLEGLPEGLVKKIKEATELTKGNERLNLNIAFNCGGRTEIVDAVRRMIEDGIGPASLDEGLFSRYLYTAGLPDPDLIVRTAGEMRFSDFLVWQGAYAEYYYTPTCWPDFDKEELYRALLAYSKRERRFGRLKTGC